MMTSETMRSVSSSRKPSRVGFGAGLEQGFRIATYERYSYVNCRIFQCDQKAHGQLYATAEDHSWLSRILHLPHPPARRACCGRRTAAFSSIALEILVSSVLDRIALFSWLEAAASKRSLVSQTPTVAQTKQLHLSRTRICDALLCSLSLAWN